MYVFISIVKLFCLNIYLFSTCVPGPCGGQKRASDPLEQESQVAMSHYVDAGDPIQVLCKSNQCS